MSDRGWGCCTPCPVIRRHLATLHSDSCDHRVLVRNAWAATWQGRLAIAAAALMWRTVLVRVLVSLMHFCRHIVFQAGRWGSCNAGIC